MSGLQTINLLFSSFNFFKPVSKVICTTSIRNYAKASPMGLGKMKKKKSAGADGPRKIIFPVENDPQKLISFVCGSNILKEGGKDIEIKPDSEYPDWLWNIRTGPPLTLEEMDPNTKQYWRKIRSMRIGEVNKRNSLRSWHKTTK